MIFEDLKVEVSSFCTLRQKLVSHTLLLHILHIVAHIAFSLESEGEECSLCEQLPDMSNAYLLWAGKVTENSRSHSGRIKKLD